jgi:hypothetical protein
VPSGICPCGHVPTGSAPFRRAGYGPRCRRWGSDLGRCARCPMRPADDIAYSNHQESAGLSPTRRPRSRSAWRERLAALSREESAPPVNDNERKIRHPIARDNLDHGGHRGDEQGEDGGAPRAEEKAAASAEPDDWGRGGRRNDSVWLTMSGRRTRRRPSQRRNASLATPLPASTSRGETALPGAHVTPPPRRDAVTPRSGSSAAPGSARAPGP